MEPYANPTKAQIEKNIALYGDATFHWATNVAVRALNKIKEEGSEDCETLNKGEYYRLSRLIIKNYGYAEALNILIKASEDVAEEQWRDFEIPNLIENTTHIDQNLKEIKGKLTISKVFEDYGIKVKGKMAVCPFHDDKDPSLSFDDEKGLWKCFGCQLKGNVFHLIGMLEKIKDGKKGL